MFEHVLEFYCISDELTISSSLMIILLTTECTMSTFNSNISASVTKLNESYTELKHINSKLPVNGITEEFLTFTAGFNT